MVVPRRFFLLPRHGAPGVSPPRVGCVSTGVDSAERPPIILSPSARIFLAAFTSLSWVVPHSGHVYDLSSSVSPSYLYPQTLHVLELGYHRSMTDSVLPYHDALYSSRRRHSPRFTSDRDFARLWFFIMPFTFRSSMQMTWLSSISLHVSS